MIKFFRNIRQSLLSENKFNKYLLYAIGEIILVVIGILIALQINNWNEFNKDRITEREYLESLEGELKRNLEVAENQINHNTLQLRNGQFILKNIIGDTILQNSKPLALATLQVYYLYPINFTHDVWDELIATGNIGLVQNKNLKEKIAKFYGRTNFTLNLEKECQTYYLGYRRTIGHILEASVWLELAEALNNDQPTKTIANLPDHQELVSRLKELKELNGYLADLISCRNFFLNTFQGYKEELESILEDISLN